MRSVLATFLSTLALAGCGGTTSPTPVTAQDSGTPAADVQTAGAHDSGTVTPTPDAGAAPDVTPPAQMYPAGPYGTSVCRTFRPFSLDQCNTADGTPAPWQFDGPDFFTSQITVISIAAGWCVPCQMESTQIEARINQHYAGMGVRFVQVLVEGPDHGVPITCPFTNTWARRYHLTNPELMDAIGVTQPYTPMEAFPGNIIVDRHGRIRFREYGTSAGLASLTNAIDDVLAHVDDPCQ